MGYRSNVSIVFYTRNEEVTPLAAIKLWFDENYPRKTATKEWGAEIETGHDWVLVTYQDVKWCGDYEHVHAVREAIDKFEETFDANDIDGTGSVELIAVGEHLDDIKERRSNYYDYRLNVRREIILD